MTSLNNYIKFTLNIEADNLEFLDTSLRKYRGREAKFVLHLDHCLVCGSDHIWHNGHSYSNLRYLALDASLPVFIRIAKERIICQDCHHNSMAETNLVNKYCHISNPVKRKIISALTEDMSMKTIAIQNSVSTCTVQRMLEKYQTTSTQDYDWLPEHLAFDEFKGVGRLLPLMVSLTMCSKSYLIDLKRIFLSILSTFQLLFVGRLKPLRWILITPMT